MFYKSLSLMDHLRYSKWTALNEELETVAGGLLNTEQHSPLSIVSSPASCASSLPLTSAGMMCANSHRDVPAVALSGSYTPMSMDCKVSLYGGSSCDVPNYGNDDTLPNLEYKDRRQQLSILQ